MDNADSISEATNQVVEWLASHDAKLVLAESCTAGLIAASLGAIPGVSQYLCGSAVVYREATKISWLKVGPQTLESFSAVSPQATDEITRGVIQSTPEANWALGITGHLGPGSPDSYDGRVFVTIYHRDGAAIRPFHSQGHRLASTDRVERQQEAVLYALRFLLECWKRAPLEERKTTAAGDRKKLGMKSIKVICCSDSPEKFSQIVDFEFDLASAEVLETHEQQLGPHFPRDLHNAAHHKEYGPVTYLQEVHEGSFAVFVGPPDQLTEHVIESGMMAAFMDDQGPGHGSKVGPEGVKRTLRVLKGHLAIPS